MKTRELMDRVKELRQTIAWKDDAIHALADEYSELVVKVAYLEGDVERACSRIGQLEAKVARLM